MRRRRGSRRGRSRFSLEGEFLVVSSWAGLMAGRSDTGYRYAGVGEHEQDRYICPAFKGPSPISPISHALTLHRHRNPLRPHLPRPPPNKHRLLPLLPPEPHWSITAPLFPHISATFECVGCDPDCEGAGCETERGDTS
jgi:hypothetical protein